MNNDEKKFIELAAETFEVEPEEINMETKFRDDIDDFSSMVGFSMICMIEDEYDVHISVNDFISCETVGDLYKLATANK